VSDGSRKATDADLSAEAIRAALTTRFVGRNLVYLPETDSTNTKARRLARQGAPEGTLVIADYQTAGRGRFNRRWLAPPGSSLLLSLIFRPPLAPHQAQRLTMLCGLALLEAIETETGLRADLKWPNDVVLAGRKVAGILTELSLRGATVDYAVVGVGLNVNLDPARLPADLLTPATALSHEAGRRVDRLSLLGAFLQAVEQRYLALRAGWSPREEWARRLVTLGRRVVISEGERTFDGLAEGVDADGALLVRLDDGRLRKVLAGDVTLRPPERLQSSRLRRFAATFAPVRRKGG